MNKLIVFFSAIIFLVGTAHAVDPTKDELINALDAFRRCGQSDDYHCIKQTVHPENYYYQKFDTIEAYQSRSDFEKRSLRNIPDYRLSNKNVNFLKVKATSDKAILFMETDLDQTGYRYLSAWTFKNRNNKWLPHRKSFNKQYSLEMSPQYRDDAVFLKEIEINEDFSFSMLFD